MAVTGIISAIIVGLIIGALGRLVLPGRQAIPIWLTIVIGIVAALVGTLLANAMGVGSTRGIDWIELFIQIILAAAGVALVAGRYAPAQKAPLTPVRPADPSPAQASRRRTRWTAASTSTAARATNRAVSMPWKSQKRSAGWKTSWL